MLGGATPPDLDASLQQALAVIQEEQAKQDAMKQMMQQAMGFAQSPGAMPQQPMSEADMAAQRDLQTALANQQKTAYAYGLTDKVAAAGDKPKAPTSPKPAAKPYAQAGAAMATQAMSKDKPGGETLSMEDAQKLTKQVKRASTDVSKAANALMGYGNGPAMPGYGVGDAQVMPGYGPAPEPPPEDDASLGLLGMDLGELANSPESIDACIAELEALKALQAAQQCRAVAMEMPMVEQAPTKKAAPPDYDAIMQQAVDEYRNRDADLLTKLPQPMGKTLPERYAPERRFLAEGPRRPASSLVHAYARILAARDIDARNQIHGAGIGTKAVMQSLLPALSGAIAPGPLGWVGSMGALETAGKIPEMAERAGVGLVSGEGPPPIPPPPSLESENIPDLTGGAEPAPKSKPRAGSGIAKRPKEKKPKEKLGEKMLGKQPNVLAKAYQKVIKPTKPGHGHGGSCSGEKPGYGTGEKCASLLPWWMIPTAGAMYGGLTADEDKVLSGIGGGAGAALGEAAGGLAGGALGGLGAAGLARALMGGLPGAGLLAGGAGLLGTIPGALAGSLGGGLLGAHIGSSVGERAGQDMKTASKRPCQMTPEELEKLANTWANKAIAGAAGLTGAGALAAGAPIAGALGGLTGLYTLSRGWPKGPAAQAISEAAPAAAEAAGLGAAGGVSPLWKYLAIPALGYGAYKYMTTPDKPQRPQQPQMTLSMPAYG
jgi:hypothetical protein